MYKLYHLITSLSLPLLNLVLKNRIAAGKEDKARINERRGIASKPRPAGRLIWLHGASVGEVTSLLGLIHKFQKHDKNLSILITSGTLASAKLLKKRLPKGVIHQFIPMDHPGWVNDFYNHWRPDLAILAESEIWPNLIMQLKARKIPSVLLNARMSDRSYKKWRRSRKMICQLLNAFSCILTQTARDKDRYEDLGHNNVIACGNIKYSAAPPPFDQTLYDALKHRLKERQIWVYASTHADEEKLACELHVKLKEDIPNLLTIIVPRHVERRHDIAKACDNGEINLIFRSTMATPPADMDIYIVDTIGELGLFYQLSEIALIGRSFSNDGGGGHNPIEAAQLGCAVLTGPLYQNLQDIFDEMIAEDAAQALNTTKALYNKLRELLTDETRLKQLQVNGQKYTQSKANILDDAFTIICQFLPKGASQKDENDAV